MPPTAAAILAALPHLPVADLQQVEQRCKALRGLGNAGAADLADSAPGAADSDSEVILRAISEQLRRLGAEFASVPVLRRAATASFRAKAAEVMDYIRASGITNRVEQAAVATVAVELLYENMTQMGVMVSSRTLLAHVHRLPAALNRAFPGYAAAGILCWIVRKPR